jgi:DNA polymerase-3 subunit gamma/tau
VSNQVLYRKWRPQGLEDVVGQEPVVRTLQQAVAQGRVAHAYLFCGPRGTGKTSTARILAKAVNCLNSQEGQPCNTCALCTSIAGGEAMDLIEIDAASNRGIDDIRNLREKVYYSPSQARYKVYIVDEVHMLTDPAFNALLKTLEEPPPHAIFVLATTAPHKLPPTVVSRCQRFDFRRISPIASVERLRVICESEGITVTDDALWAISKSASGSLRDAINVLDQMIVSYGGEFGAAQVQELLGLGDEEGALRLMECVLSGDLAEGLGVIHTVAMNGVDLTQFHKQVVEYLRGALLVRSGAEGGLDHSVEALERLKQAAAGPDMNALVRAVRLFSQVDVRADVSSPLPLELALVEASLRAPSPVAQAAPATVPPPAQPQPAAKPKVAESAPVVPPVPVPLAPPVAKKAEPAIAETSLSEAAAQEGSVQEPPPPPAPVVQESSSAAVEQGIARAPSAAPVAGAIDIEALEGRWTKLISALQRKKGRRFYLGGLMRDSRSHDLEGGVLILRFGSRSNMERLKGELQTPEGRKAMSEGMEAVLGSQLEVRVEMAESVSEGPAQGGHLVRMALARGGRIVQESEAKTAEGQEDQPD